MKVYIGPYKNWIGPYQLADLLQRVGVSEDRCYSIGCWLSNTWIMSVCQWFEKKRKRNVSIRIDKYDTWSMDATLALIITPMLKQLKETKHGAPYVDDADVPEELRSTNDPELKTREYGVVDSLFFERWDYVLSEMIWAFEQLSPDNEGSLIFHHNGVVDVVGLTAYEDRKKKGFMLFGKYFQGLWD